MEYCSEIKATMRKEFAKNSPTLDVRLHALFEDEKRTMEQYSEWRDPEDEEDLRAQATRNGFIAVPTHEPNCGNVYTQFNR
ncbi:hypothetical protein Tcan_10854 [Toxocara canis]|uniref:Uncharacterized protein n=1 Tax=Toxocara canis TaxID=6265 RepID=A0A0B2W487_TOXCA|nr:hypothetical protein Tcan_10854 [Toxocara canis]